MDSGVMDPAAIPQFESGDSPEHLLEIARTPRMRFDERRYHLVIDPRDEPLPEYAVEERVELCPEPLRERELETNLAMHDGLPRHAPAQRDDAERDLAEAGDRP